MLLFTYTIPRENSLFSKSKSAILIYGCASDGSKVLSPPKSVINNCFGLRAAFPICAVL